MPKSIGTPGGRITRIVSETEEKQIIDYLSNRDDLSSLPSIERKKLKKKSSKFSVVNKGIGEWPKGEVLLYTRKVTGMVPIETKIYAGEYRVKTLCQWYHDNKGHMGRNRTYQ